MTVEPSLANELQRRLHSFQHGYLPTDNLVVDPSVEFNTDRDDEIDPITYEVIRSKLWNINLDQGDTIRRVSGSNIVVEGYDFNCAIATEIGDAVTLAPYAIFFAGSADEVIKWTLEHRSMNVGVHDGDIFIQDDPWVGANHQMDTSVYGPLFWDGKLFGWIFNCVHHRELGGSQPGGFVQDAMDVHTEPTFMPPLKLAEHGVVREDVVDAWVRRSRMPELMRLELNSQLTGYRLAFQRVVDLIERYGASTVKAVMYTMIENTARFVGERLSTLPDATWRDERYVAGARQGDNSLYKVCMSFEKSGDRLHVSNLGSNAATGSFNMTPGVMRAVVLNALLPTIAYDQYLCAAGVLRQLDFEFEEGAITSASHPAAVSAALGSLIGLTQAHNLAGKMVSGNPELSRHTFASASLHTPSMNAMFGTDQYGNQYADMALDTVNGGIGAFSHRDGIDHGGPLHAVAARFSDAEKYEQSMPFLYLYRRELPGSGGHGRWRGGAAFIAAWVGHKSDDSVIASGGLLKSVTQGMGLCGGYPGTGGYNWRAEDTNIQQALREGFLAGDPTELRKVATNGDVAPPKKYDNRLGADDVFELMPNPGGGWGDPLDREPALVAADVISGRSTEAECRNLYGLVLDADGAPDLTATKDRRAEIAVQRLERARSPRAPVAGTVDPASAQFDVVEGVAACETANGLMFACSRCGQLLGVASEGYRTGCRELDELLEGLSDLFTSPKSQTGEDLVFRRYLCPNCGVVIDGQVCRPDDLPYRDVWV